MPAISADYCESVSRSLEFLLAEYASPATEEPNARWKLSSVASEDGLETACLQNSDAEFVTVRGRMHFPGIKPCQVLELIHDCVNRTAWDEMLQTGSFVKEYGALKTALLPDANADIIHLIYKGIMGVSARDLCLLRAWGQDEDGKCWLVAESCNDEALPVDDKYIRAELRECGYMMIPTGDGCDVVYISQTNFKGWIPSFMLNIISLQQPESLRKMQAVIKQHMMKHGPSPSTQGLVRMHEFLEVGTSASTCA